MSFINTRPLSLINHLNRDVFRTLGYLEGAGSDKKQWWPGMDIIEESGRFVLLVDIPGVDPQSIEITSEDGILSIGGKREINSTGDDQIARIRERSGGEFNRRFKLSDNVDADAITASGKHGVLEILIPKKAEVQPRRIPVTH
ncbi:MAG: Hsp20/alpha crystallin family protein [Gammaproteobacteria bacterium]|nr:Hsp20/alpha crystallin family protein [Gammaproteobacteria bacterium]